MTSRQSPRAARLRHVALLFVALFSLSPQQASDAARLPLLSYQVRIPSLEAGRVEVSLSVTGVDQAKPLVIRSVPLYMDNPLAAADGPAISELRVTDSASGKPLAVTTREDHDGEKLFEIADQNVTEVRIDYSVRIRFKESDQTRQYPIRIPYMNRKQALLYGNYLFCYPELGKDKQDSIALPVRIDVTLDTPADAYSWGISRQFSLHTIYQLMSLQFGFGVYQEDRLSVSPTRLALAYERAGDFSRRERDALRKVVSTAFETTRDLFGGAPFDRFWVLLFRDQAVGGMEGTFACQVFAPRDMHLADAGAPAVRNFYSIITHEIFHAWNPIAVYPRGDPWVKEGITCYYGEVLSARAGLLKESDAANSFGYYKRQLEQNKLLRKYTLTDPLIWLNEYKNEDWRTLTYERGKAVALLLDLEIRDKTANRHSLDDVMRFLYEHYRNRSYSHDELGSAVTAATGVDLSDFFENYVSGTRLASEKEIEAARKRVMELGVYKAAEFEEAVSK